MKGNTARKVSKVLVCFLLCSFILMGASGCWWNRYTEREVGDFTVRFYNDYCDIYGTTEQGNSKRFLVIPEYIDGVRVDCFGSRKSSEQHQLTSCHGVARPNIDSIVLEKIYFERAIDFYPLYPPHDLLVPSLKILYPGAELYPEDSWGIYIYFPRYLYEQEEGMRGSNKCPANVSFYYNYEDAANNGYYWIDDCDYGGKIEYIPKEPTREGYTFGGWYKEAECISPWDFENDTLPEEQFKQIEIIKGDKKIIKEVTVYQETILYAKWIES